MARANRLLLALLLVLLSVRASGQDTLGKRVDISFDMAGARASALDVRAGLDIARFLGLGVAWGMGMDDAGIVDLGLGVWCTASLLSEGEMGMPVTFVIRGSFSKIRSLGAALTDQDLVRSGTAADLGAEVSRTFRLSPRLDLLAAIEGAYTFKTLTTEAMAGSGSTFDTLIVPEAQWLFGIRVGLGLPVAEHIRLLFTLRAALDGDLVVHYGPSASLISR